MGMSWGYSILMMQVYFQQAQGKKGNIKIVIKSDKVDVIKTRMVHQREVGIYSIIYILSFPLALKKFQNKKPVKHTRQSLYD